MKTSRTLPPPGSPDAPNYWMYEQSGVLVPVVTAYLEGKGLSSTQVSVMRAYLRQWIMSPVWEGEEIAPLRDGIDAIRNTGEIDAWLARALDLGIDPL